MRDDVELMAQARRAGLDARRRTAPNPWVGCVIVADGVVVGRGASEPPGGAHAEVGALGEAGGRARGATAYVTLEPCSHHGRTGPCVDALLAAGITRVVAALEDPDPKVAGHGIAGLRAAGVRVEVGCGADDVTRDLAPYLHHRRTGRAFAILKTATSLDGRTGAADGSSQWITGAAARADGHGLRADCQAVLVGSRTAIADRPALTARDVDAAGPPLVRQPLRVLLDARGRVPADGPLFDPTLAPTLVLTTTAAPSARLDEWRASGAKVEALTAGRGGGVDLAEALTRLGADGVLGALVEGGAAVHGALVAAGLAERIVQYTGGVVLGEAGRPAFAGPGPARLDAATRWRLTDIRTLGADARLDWEPA